MDICSNPFDYHDYLSYVNKSRRILRPFFLFFDAFDEGFDVFISLHTPYTSTNDTFSIRHSSVVSMQLIISRIGHNRYKKACLALGKIRRMLIEIILRCLLYSVDTVSEFYDIEIDFHNPFFAPQELHR